MEEMPYLILNRSLMHILARISSPPPPIPWSTLPAISCLMLILKAAMRDPTKKAAFAVKMMGLRPQMSLSLPHVGTLPAAASRYAEPIQV